MVAQRFQDALVDAVEIDAGAFEQAGENFAASPWINRLNVFHERIQEFNKGKYDLIISNPPFYINDLKSNDHKRNLALHSGALDLEELLNCVKRLLADEGMFAILLPYHRSEDFGKLAEKADLFAFKKLSVKQTPKHSYFRVMYLLSPNATETETSEIIIKDSNQQYTLQFTDLLKDYYL
jgi:tRNA1Val (adenine37-N6)-methyltransferase